VSNPGTARLMIKSIIVSGDFEEANNCPISPEPLPPGTHCTVNVRLDPKTKGIHEGAIVLTDNAPTRTQKVRLTGTGTFAQLLPTELSFNPQPVGTKSLAKTIVLTNSGPVTVNITKISITGSGALDFPETNNCGKELTSRASCVIKVTFKPSEVGKRVGNVSVIDDGGGSPQIVGLIGTGN